MSAPPSARSAALPLGRGTLIALRMFAAYRPPLRMWPAAARVLLRIVRSDVRVALYCWSHGTTIREVRRLHRLHLLTGGAAMNAPPRPANSNAACDLPAPCPCRGGGCPMEQRGGSGYHPGEFVALIEEVAAVWARARRTRPPPRPRPRLVT